MGSALGLAIDLCVLHIRNIIVPVYTLCGSVKYFTPCRKNATHETKEGTI